MLDSLLYQVCPNLPCMRSRTLNIEQRASEAIERAEQYLLACQNADGLWRDYDLEPGPAEAWTTAYIGHALLRTPTTITARHQGIEEPPAQSLVYVGLQDGDTTEILLLMLTPLAGL